MNREERLNQAGAPGPAIAERDSRARPPLERVTGSSPALEPDSAGTIVVGLGNTDRAADALVLAQLLAEPLGAPLVLVHNEPREGPVVDAHSDPTVRLAQADSPVDGLRQIAEQENAQLIVIGPSKPSGLGRLRPRSVGERLLSDARLPVAIAPRGYAEAEHSLSLVASAFDGSPESRGALEWAERLTTNAAGRLRVISVHEPMPVTGLGFTAQSVEPGLRRDLKREQAAAIAVLDRSAEGVVRNGSPAGVLVEAAREADLLVMGSRGHGPLPAALLGGVAHYVIRRASCPVVIHPPRRSLP